MRGHHNHIAENISRLVAVQLHSMNSICTLVKSSHSKLKDFPPPRFPHPDQKVWRIVGALSAKAGLKLPQTTSTPHRPISDIRRCSNSEISIFYCPRLWVSNKNMNIFYDDPGEYKS